MKKTNNKNKLIKYFNLFKMSLSFILIAFIVIKKWDKIKKLISSIKEIKNGRN